MSRSVDHGHRPRRRVPALVTAVTVLVAGVLVAVNAGQRLASGQWPVPVQTAVGRLEQTPWSSVLGWGIGLGLVLVGVLLVVGALAPGRSAGVRLTGSATASAVRTSTAHLTSGGLTRLAAGRMAEIDGVDKAAVVRSGRRLRATVQTSVRDVATLRATVRTSVTTRLGDAGVAPVPRITVKTVRRPVRL